MNQKSATVYRTDNYAMFKRLSANRGVTRERASKIIKSINDVGYVMSPIIVNEKREVIDGQGRLEALKALGLPVDYIVVKGIGIDECVSMNINQTNWGVTDYIDSFAERGNTSYIYLKQLVKQFGKLLRLKVIYNAATGKVDTPIEPIKRGDFKCSENDYNFAVDVLSYLLEFRDIINKIEGHTEFYYMGLAFCYRDPGVDNDRLLEKIKKLQANLIPVTTIVQALDNIEGIYNHRIRDKVYIKTDYQQWLDGKYTWYKTRYGNKWEV